MVDDPKDLRPIALCNVLYKIIAKVLANRLQKILPQIISEEQSAFVPGRNITDNVLVAFEILHYMKRKHSGQDGVVALKLDISKAYDRVSWDYLRYRMRAMGFSDKWIKWVMLCVTTVSYTISFQGSMIGPINLLGFGATNAADNRRKIKNSETLTRGSIYKVWLIMEIRSNTLLKLYVSERWRSETSNHHAALGLRIASLSSPHERLIAKDHRSRY